MRAPRTTYIAFSKFKKMCDILCTNPDLAITCSPTKAALATMQTFVERGLMRILLIAADNKRGRTLDEAEMRRAHAFMNHFLLKEKTSLVCPVDLPKKLCVRELKKERGNCRVTQGAIEVIANMYAYLTRVALEAVNGEAVKSTKKRVSPEIVAATLNQVGTRVKIFE